MTGPEWRLDGDRQTITVTFPTVPRVVLKLDAAQVDKMLENLGHLRAVMQPGHAPNFAPGQKVIGVRNPRWLAEPDMMQGDSLLHLRDPWFGWRHYLFPREEATKLACVLRNQVEAPPPTSAKTKPH